MKTAPFDSPLRESHFVRTDDGFTVRILGEARMFMGEYRILVQVLKSKEEYKHLVGKQFYGAHHSPFSFANSKITHINSTPVKNLEEYKGRGCFQTHGSHTGVLKKR